MWRTYALCEPILAYIKNDWVCNATGLHQRTASETMKSNDDGSFFVKYASSGGWWCEIKPATEKVTWMIVRDRYTQSSAVFKSK